jgi:hypothetical protein
LQCLEVARLIERFFDSIRCGGESLTQQEAGMANMLSRMGNYQEGESKISWQAEMAGAKK